MPRNSHQIVPVLNGARRSTSPKILKYFRALLISVLILGTADPLRSQISPKPEVSAASDLVHFGDLIDVDVVGSFEYDWRGGITPEGFLDGMDRIPNQVYALCRSESEIARSVAAEYSAILRDPQVIVRVLDRSKRPEVFLNGAVKTPHRFQVRRSVRLNELLIQTGGITDVSSGEITIFRPAGSTCESSTNAEGETTYTARRSSETIRIKISDLLKGVDTANPLIFSGDVIDVTPAWPIYVIGGVNNPTQLALRSELTVSRAVASAGGISKEGAAGSAVIYRRGDGRPEIIEADLEKIEAGTAQDIQLKPFDIIEIAQKGRGRSQFPPVIETSSRSGADAQLPLKIID